MLIYIDFEDPLYVSSGSLFDQAHIEVKNEFLFVSEDSGKRIQVGSSLVVDNFPKQVGKDVDLEMLERQAD